MAVVQLIEQFLSLMKIPPIACEQCMAKEVLLEPIKALRVLRIQPFLQPTSTRSQSPVRGGRPLVARAGPPPGFAVPAGAPPMLRSDLLPLLNPTFTIHQPEN